MEKLIINQLSGGVVDEQIQREWRRILHNLQDRETSSGASRKLTITLNCKQDESRTNLVVDVTVTSKLADRIGSRSTFSSGTDENGKAYAVEYRPISAKQMSLDLEAQEAISAVEAEVAEYEVDEETGEIISEKVLDLRKAR